MDNAEKFKKWFGSKQVAIWDIFQDASRMQLLFGVGLLLMVYPNSSREARSWAKADGVLEIRSTSFPGAQLAKNPIKI